MLSSLVLGPLLELDQLHPSAKVPVTILVPAACPRKGRLPVESLFGLSFGLLSHEVSFPYDVSQMWAATCTGVTSPG